jgi:hypothetical protein
MLTGVAGGSYPELAAAPSAVESESGPVHENCQNDRAQESSIVNFLLRSFLCNNFLYIYKTLGVSNRTEIIPFEPDAVCTAEGKSDGNTYCVAFLSS